MTKIQAYLDAKERNFKGISRKKIDEISKISFALKDGEVIHNAKILDMNLKRKDNERQLQIHVSWPDGSTFGKTEILTKYCHSTNFHINWDLLHCPLEYGDIEHIKEYEPEVAEA